MAIALVVVGVHPDSLGDPFDLGMMMLSVIYPKAEQEPATMEVHWALEAVLLLVVQMRQVTDPSLWGQNQPVQAPYHQCIWCKF
jgi:hypothetical protein